MSVIIVKLYLVLDFVPLVEFVLEKSQKYVQIAGLNHLALFVQLVDFALVQARLRRKELTLVVHLVMSNRLLKNRREKRIKSKVKVK